MRYGYLKQSKRFKDMNKREARMFMNTVMTRISFAAIVIISLLLMYL